MVAISVGTVPVVVTGNVMEKVGSVLVIIAVFLLAFLLPIFVSANEKKMYPTTTFFGINPHDFLLLLFLIH